MTTEHTANGLIGASPKRVEDPPLVTGRGCYVDDINLPGMLHVAFQRSPYPHAKIVSIDVIKAKAMPGVEAVVTGSDLGEKLNLAPSQLLPNMKIPSHPVLARGSVHCVGVPVAAVVARTRAQAQDAANAIDVEYEALPGVANAEEALKPGAPLAREEIDSNICYTLIKNGGNVDKAFAAADHVFTMHIASPRQVALAMEPRGIAVRDGGIQGCERAGPGERGRERGLDVGAQLGIAVERGLRIPAERKRAVEVHRFPDEVERGRRSQPPSCAGASATIGQTAPLCLRVLRRRPA